MSAYCEQNMEEIARLREALAKAEQDLADADEALAACRAEAAGQIETLREALRDCEWNGYSVGDNPPCCPSCGEFETDGHTKTCPVYLALASGGEGGGECPKRRPEDTLLVLGSEEEEVERERMREGGGET